MLCIRYILHNTCNKLFKTCHKEQTVRDSTRQFKRCDEVTH